MTRELRRVLLEWAELCFTAAAIVSSVVFLAVPGLREHQAAPGLAVTIGLLWAALCSWALR